MRAWLLQSPLISKATDTCVWPGQGPSPQNTSGQAPGYSRLRATHPISFQTGDLWLTGRQLFLGTASASSKRTHNRPPLPSARATLTAQLPTRVRAQLQPPRLGQRLLLISTWGLPIAQVIVNNARSASDRPCFSPSSPLKNYPQSLFQATVSASTAPSSTDRLMSSESATSDEPQLAWNCSKGFSLKFCCTMWSK